MEKEKMTIHRALAELKLIDSKIQRALTEIQPVGGKRKNALVNDIMTEEEFKNKAVGSLQKGTDLIERKNMIKTKIMESNAKTKVTVGKKKMSIAEVIFYKEVITNKQQLLNKLISEKAKVFGNIENHNNMIKNNALQLAQNALGNANVKMDDKDVLAITEPYTDKHKIDFFDTLKIDKEIEKLQEEIDLFGTEVDAILSESNAVTIIEV